MCRLVAVGHVSFEDEHRVPRQVVEEGCRGLEEQRQVVLDALRGEAGADVLVDLAVADVDIERAVPGIAESGDSGRVERGLPGRQDAHAPRWGDGPLAVGVEDAQRVDFVIEQVDADGVVRAHREDVHERAAYGELAAFTDRVGGAVARAG